MTALLTATSAQHRPKLIIPVGIPGCGKSTLAARLVCPAVSTDAIRAQLTGDASRQDANDQVFDEYHRLLEALLRETPLAPAFADATNLDRAAREPLYEIAERTGAETHVFLFTNTLEAINRNRRRQRVVPDDVMLRMVEKYERALLELPQETYTSITRIGSVR